MPRLNRYVPVFRTKWKNVLALLCLLGAFALVFWKILWTVAFTSYDQDDSSFLAALSADVWLESLGVFFLIVAISVAVVRIGGHESGKGNRAVNGQKQDRRL
jgi:hypothetical protein